MSQQIKKYRRCRDLKVGDRIDQGGRNAKILEISLGDLEVAALLEFDDTGEISRRYWSFLWQQDTMIQRYEAQP